MFLILKVIADSASVLRSRKQVVTMIATVVVFFFVCMFPIKVCIFYEIFTLWMWGQINFLEKRLSTYMDFSLFFFISWYILPMYFFNVNIKWLVMEKVNLSFYFRLWIDSFFSLIFHIPYQFQVLVYFLPIIDPYFMDCHSTCGCIGRHWHQHLFILDTFFKSDVLYQFSH